jgi:hypothetical protein
MPPPSLAIVTATTNLARARPCLESWMTRAHTPPALFVVLNADERPLQVTVAKQHVAWMHRPDYLGSVPAFRLGVDTALEGPFSIIACLHDDFEIHEDGWDLKVAKYFDRNPNLGLAGFGGAIGLGALDMYDRPYDPMSLARVGFRSDLEDAETHGMRSLLAEPVACLDGFSQIGYRGFWEGRWSPIAMQRARNTGLREVPVERPWATLERLGLVHHFYDGALGCLAARLGWETWYLPLRSKHWGGRTAVGDAGYQAWAKGKDPRGDQGFWEEAHWIGYQAFRDVLPLRV